MADRGIPWKIIIVEIVEVKTKRQIIFLFAEITIKKKRIKSFFERENRENWRLVVTATIMRYKLREG